MHGLATCHSNNWHSQQSCIGQKRYMDGPFKESCQPFSSVDLGYLESENGHSGQFPGKLITGLESGLIPPKWAKLIFFVWGQLKDQLFAWHWGVAVLKFWISSFPGILKTYYIWNTHIPLHSNTNTFHYLSWYVSRCNIFEEPIGTIRVIARRLASGCFKKVLFFIPDLD